MVISKGGRLHRSALSPGITLDLELVPSPPGSTGWLILSLLSVSVYQRRVEMWRGGFRLGILGSGPFGCRCLTSLAMAPFPHPAHKLKTEN